VRGDEANCKAVGDPRRGCHARHSSGVCLEAEEAQDPVKPLQASGVIASVDALGGVVTLKESTHLDPATGTIAQPTSYLVHAKTVVSKDK